ncbi:PEP-CTERM sorting domain-containing protein [Cerasicoccus maritimus]|uniref:PEP-CTERM sorting domain-containing protein n=1 Tax=Cerasicoccus maritimus TaxID=490089 RepID=UPI002852BDC8|nr:PEP-CTERM sorting domain-containing protein [Cerasicoccus maritimus]
MKLIPSLLLAASPLLSTSASAVIELTISYDTDLNSVTMSYTGSLDSYSLVANEAGDYWSISDDQGLRSLSDYSYSSGGVDTPYPWDGLPDGTVLEADSFEGMSFGFSTTQFYAPENYTAGDYIVGDITFDSITLADLGLSNGDSGVLTGSGNTINWTATLAAEPIIPEPSTYALITGLLGMVFVLRSRRTHSRVN